MPNKPIRGSGIERPTQNYDSEIFEHRQPVYTRNQVWVLIANEVVWLRMAYLFLVIDCTIDGESDEKSLDGTIGLF